RDDKGVQELLVLEGVHVVLEANPLTRRERRKIEVREADHERVRDRVPEESDHQDDRRGDEGPALRRIGEAALRQLGLAWGGSRGGSHHVLHQPSKSVISSVISSTASW